jgi:hypothetical protein
MSFALPNLDNTHLGMAKVAVKGQGRRFLKGRWCMKLIPQQNMFPTDINCYSLDLSHKAKDRRSPLDREK